MPRAERLEEWVNGFSSSDKEFDSIHFDELIETSSLRVAGEALVSHALTMLNAVALQLERTFDEQRAKRIFVHIPLDITDEMLTWSPELWQKAGTTFEPPSLYLLRDPQIFHEDWEEYRTPVAIPVPHQNRVVAVFRSCRSAQAIRENWEFNSSIYLVLDVVRDEK